ncbi:MAG: sigma-70 family RNA polymerase sigma factor [Gallionella sp.]
MTFSKFAKAVYDYCPYHLIRSPLPKSYMSENLDFFAGLMQRANAGDSRAYTELLQKTAQLLRPYLAKRLLFASDVDDVLQEILLSVHKARHTYDGGRPYLPWAYAIARFRLSDYLRSHYADDLKHASDIADWENLLPDAVTESAFSYESIRTEVEKLPEKQATILQLMHEQGYTAKEVASLIGMNESAVKVAAHRAYKILKTRLMP